MTHKEDNKSKFSFYYDKYMLFAGMLGQYLFYAQAYKVFTTKSAKDLSLDGFIVIMISTLSWLVYGIIHKSIPIIAAQVVAIIGMVMVVAGILLYT